MGPLSKVCDAADWFDPAMLRLIREELEELPRFHRKQWEFALILRALAELGLLSDDRVGLSMGGGRERLLYAVARRVGRLVVTDLYDPKTTWESARTGDPGRFVMEGKPFPVDDARLTALRMDMRSLDFPDECFDFCYSACAIEHIGVREDFLRHLNEAYRVLKDRGVYVLTTEFHYGPEVIEHPQNFLFSADYLRDLLMATDFTPEPEFDARIAPHKANFPVPPDLEALCLADDGQLSNFLLREFTHVQLLRGGHAHSSASLLLRKDTRARRGAQFRVIGLERSRDFLAAGIAEYRSRVERSRLRLNPLAFLPGGVSSYCAGQKPSHAGGTVFHTDYAWLGSGRRSFTVAFEVAEALEDSVLELRIHAQRGLGPPEVRCVETRSIAIKGPGRIHAELRVDVEERDSYALLGRLHGDSCRFEHIRVESLPSPA